MPIYRVRYVNDTIAVAFASVLETVMVFMPAGTSGLCIIANVAKDDVLVIDAS